MKIQWIGQSGYILKTDSTTLCIDPYLSDVVEELAGKKRLVSPPVSAENICADAVVCSHNHLDHLDIKTVPKLISSTFYAPSDCRSVLKELGVKDYKVFDEGASFTIGDFTIKAVYANHTVPAVGLLVKCEGKTLYFSGDTYYDDNLLNIKQNSLDYAFICINGKLGNMNVEEAVKFAKDLSPAWAIPNHYGMFAENTEDPYKFADELNNAFVMELGKEYEVGKCLI